MALLTLGLLIGLGIFILIVGTVVVIYYVNKDSDNSQLDPLVPVIFYTIPKNENKVDYKNPIKCSYPESTTCLQARELLAKGKKDNITSEDIHNPENHSGIGEFKDNDKLGDIYKKNEKLSVVFYEVPQAI